MSSPVLRPSLAMGGVLLCLAALTSSYAHDGDRDHDRPRAYACLLYTSPSPRDS